MPFPQYSRRILARWSSLLLLLQRSPIIQAFLPEARFLGEGATGQITKWTVASVAGLGVFDSVAGATLHSAPTINQQPSSVTISHGGATTLSVFATGSGILSYQWFQSVSGATLIAINGASNPSYTTSNLTATTRFTVRVSNTGGSVYSNIATVTVITPPHIKKNPKPATILKGSTAILVVKATGTTLAYQWFKGNSGDTTRPIRHANSATYQTTPLNASANFWAQVTNPVGQVDSDTVAVTVTKPF